MMPPDGATASLMQADATSRGARPESSRARLERLPNRLDRANDREDADAVGADFEHLLRQVAGRRDPAAYADDFARQVAEANRHAAANQRITDDDLRVADEQQRSADRRASSRQDASPASAVTIQRGELGKGELGHLYRPLRAAGAGSRSEAAADPSSTGDLANSRASSQHDTDTAAKATGKGTDPTEPGKSRIALKSPETPNSFAKASAADVRMSSLAPVETAARASAQRVDAPSHNRNTPGGERAARSVQPQIRPTVVQRSSEPGPQSQSRQESDAGPRDMKKPAETPARMGSASKATHTGGLSKPIEQKTINDVQRVLLANRGARHSRVRLQLRPPELGQLTIEMRMEKDTLRIRFEAERPEVGELLKSNATLLSKALAEQGVSVERYEVVSNEADGESARFDKQLDAHGGLQDSSADTDSRPAEEENEEHERIEGADEAADEEGAPAVGADRRLDIEA